MKPYWEVVVAVWDGKGGFLEAGGDDKVWFFGQWVDF
jgi:hypothetical protein